MREKTRKLILSIFLAACIVALMAASLSYTLTNGRYTGGKLSEDSLYGDIIDFVGATAYEVSSPEELVNAIENGYSYIEIADVAEEPFVVNSDIADVEVNLVLDVNGHIVVRNSRNPLINVQKSVSVVLVYDSSQAATGGFYNPVGSALQTSGGTLTVGAGIYESGPDVKPISSIATEEITDIFVRDGDRHSATGYKKADSAANLPKLTEDVYFENDSTEGYLRNDTYLIYTEESNCRVQGGQLYVNCTANAGTRFSVESNVASCDFYYYYKIGTQNTDGTQDYAVVYGYHDVKGLARNENGAAKTLQEKGLVWPYAAIRSEAGNTFARGGTFQTYFGEEETYCIYSAGGTMTVGGSATPEFSALQSGVCIKMEEGQENEAELRSAPSLTIDSGTFSSEIGDTIKMFGGKMNVKAGTFTKTGCKKDTENDQIDNQTAIISLQGGTLNVDGTKSGEENAPVYSVTMKAGGDANGGTLQNVFGIRAVGGGKITTEGVSFDIYGDYSAGVLSYNGTINLGSDTLINVKQSDNTTVLTSAGVSSEASGTQQDHPVNLTGNVTINSNGLGITARGVVNVTGTGSAVNTSRGTGIYVNNGEFHVETGASISVTSTVKSGYSWATPPGSGTTNVPNIYNGVYVQGGSLVSNGTLNVTFTGLSNDAFESGDTYLTQQIKSYAVRVEAASGSATQVTIVKGKIINQVKYAEDGKEIGGGGGGIYVGGGTVTLGTKDAGNSNLSVYTQGSSADNDSHYVSGGDWQYDWTITGGHAVEVQGGSLTVNSGTYTAEMGNGILVRNLEGSDQSYTVTVNNGIFAGYNGSGRRVGPGAFYALKVMGGPLTLNVTGGTFGKDNTDNFRTNGSAFVMGDPVNKKRATVNVTGGNYYSYQSDCFSIFRYVDIAFETENITMNAVRNNNSDVFAAVAVQDDLVYNDNEHEARGSTIEIAGGKYTGVGYGLWYGASVDAVAVSGGTFTGTNEAGLYFGVAPGKTEDRSNVQLSGGMFTGGESESHYAAGSAYTYYENGGIGTKVSTYRGYYNGPEIKLRDIIANGHDAYNVTGNNNDRIEFEISVGYGTRDAYVHRDAACYQEIEVR